jgi:SAM-dependent methyltransferase
MNTMQNRFGEVFKNNIWGDPLSSSGPGSSLEQTRVIRTYIPSLLRRLQIRSMLDIPCGDFFWMKEISAELDLVLSVYIGADIVAEVIQQNKERYQRPKFHFEVLDLTRDDLPKCDLVMIRDCFIHLSFSSIADAILNVQRSGATYLLASTYTMPRPNPDVEGVSILGRVLNLCTPPFNFPDPLDLIEEKCTEQDGKYSDKSLGLWRLQDLNVMQLRRRIRARRAVKDIRRFAVRLARVPKRVASTIYRKIW